MATSWGEAAAWTIERTMKQAKDAGLTPKQTLALIDSRYPFGSRSHWPYKAWLKERKRAMRLLGIKPQSQGSYACKFCQDRGCLACLR